MVRRRTLDPGQYSLYCIDATRRRLKEFIWLAAPINASFLSWLPAQVLFCGNQELVSYVFCIFLFEFLPNVFKHAVFYRRVFSCFLKKRRFYLLPLVF
jgi:hypothetical protein